MMILAGFDVSYSKQVGTIAVSFTGLYLLFKFYVMKIEDEKILNLWASFIIPFVIPSVIGFILSVLQFYFQIYGKNDGASFFKICGWYIVVSITTVFCFGLWMAYVNRRENYIGKELRERQSFQSVINKMFIIPGVIIFGVVIYQLFAK
jgi:hypothetical protein